jgi:hypothetical protein
MTKKRKLKLDELKVKSFVTVVDSQYARARGGEEVTAYCTVGESCPGSCETCNTCPTNCPYTECGGQCETLPTNCTCETCGCPDPSGDSCIKCPW